MNLATYLLAAATVMLASLVAQAQVVIPSDIGMTLSASPSTDLVTGQPINFTLTVTNYGLSPVSFLVLSSSNFTDQFNITENINECYIYATVVDAETPYYFFNWGVAVTGNTPAFLPGETRICHFQLSLRSNAPAVMPFSFGVNPYFSDSNPSNDTGTVILQRAIVPIPALSAVMLSLLAAALLIGGCVVRRRWI